MQLPIDTSRRCLLRDDRITSACRGTVSVHPHESLLIERIAATRTTEGTQVLRQRTDVERALAAFDQIQSKRARYKGAHKTSSIFARQLLDTRETDAEGAG